MSYGNEKLTPDNIGARIDKLYDREPGRYLPSWVAFRLVRQGVNAANFTKAVGLYSERRGGIWHTLIKQKLEEQKHDAVLARTPAV